MELPRLRALRPHLRITHLLLIGLERPTQGLLQAMHSPSRWPLELYDLLTHPAGKSSSTKGVVVLLKSVFFFFLLDCILLKVSKKKKMA